MKTTSCGILVLDREGELLLGHATGTPYWDLPKGGNEPGETMLQTALREAAEETGLQFEPRQLIELGRFAYRPSKDLHLFATLIERIDPGRCECSTRFRTRWGELRPEFDRFAWVPFGELPQHCARNMTTLLTRTLSLPELLQRLARAAA